MKELKFIFLLCFISTLHIGYSQISDTVVILPLVELQQYKVRTSPTGSSIINFDSLQMLQNHNRTLAEILGKSSGIYIKSYGNYSLATASIRGAGTSQNLVLWNGLPIESPSLGQLDLNLMPVTFVNKVQLIKGGNSSSWGSAAIGGTISLDNEMNFTGNIAIDYHSSIGSFGNLVQNIDISLGNKFIQSKTQLLYVKAKNDIKYRRAENQPWEKQKNAAFHQKALMQSLHFKFNKDNKLNFHVWLQDAFKEIPASTVQNQSLAKQNDESIRFMGNWSYLKKKLKAEINSGFFREKQIYIDPLSLDTGKNNFDKILADIELGLYHKKSHYLWFANTHNYTTANTKAYGEVQKVYRMGIVLGYKFMHKKIDLQFSIREEMNRKKWIVPSPLLGIEYKANNFLSIKTKFTRDYRFPTFNDLFWTPGGNLDLEPEQGWSEELGVEINKKVKKHKIEFGSTYFNRNIKNWIMWVPPSTGFTWEAHNITKVWSWGFENIAAYTFSNYDFNTSYQINIDYTSSTYRTDYKLPKIVKGDQLLYTPKLRINNQVKIEYKGFAFNFTHQYISASNGVNENIKPYNICNVGLSQSFNHKKISGLLFFNINNIFNKEYYVIERRPTAGINFLTGINILFKHKKQAS